MPKQQNVTSFNYAVTLLLGLLAVWNSTKSLCSIQKSQTFQLFFHQFHQLFSQLLSQLFSQLFSQLSVIHKLFSKLSSSQLFPSAFRPTLPPCLVFLICFSQLFPPFLAAVLTADIPDVPTYSRSCSRSWCPSCSPAYSRSCSLNSLTAVRMTGSEVRTLKILISALRFPNNALFFWHSCETSSSAFSSDSAVSSSSAAILADKLGCSALVLYSSKDLLFGRLVLSTGDSTDTPDVLGTTACCLTAAGTGKPAWDWTGFQQGPKSGNVSGGRSGGILFTRFRHSSKKEIKKVLRTDPEP